VKPADTDTAIALVIRDLARLFRDRFDRRVRDLGLTESQWRAILQLSRNPGINQAQLAEALEIQPISVCRLIDRMAARGWVERMPDPADRRAVRLLLTPKVEPVLNELHRRAAGLLAEAFAGLSRTARSELHEHLHTIKRNLASANGARAGLASATDAEIHAETAR